MARRKTSGTWAKVIHAARKATSSTKCGENLGASTETMSVLIMQVNAVRKRTFPRGNEQIVMDPNRRGNERMDMALKKAVVLLKKS